MRWCLFGGLFYFRCRLRALTGIDRHQTNGYLDYYIVLLQADYGRYVALFRPHYITCLEMDVHMLLLSQTSDISPAIFQPGL